MLRYSDFATYIEGIDLEGDVSSQFYLALQMLFVTDPCEPVENEGKREKMDTLGSLIDKLSIVTTRMWHAQDELYRFRKMTKAEWAKEFGNDPDRVRAILKRACDLNLQRNQLMDAIDKLNVEQLEMSEEERKKLYQPKHKLY